MHKNGLLLAVGVFAFSLMSEPSGGVAKPKNCFTSAEESAEAIVRYGLRLREGARICSDPPFAYNLIPLWQSIDQQFGSRFARQKTIREGAFTREFGNDAINKLQMWDGREVLRYRSISGSPEFCTHVEAELKDMQSKGWGAFNKLAVKAADEVKMDFRPCH